MIELDVTIMGQSYRLMCKADEERALREASVMLDKKMTGIRASGRVKGNDRIAVMAALSVAAEFLSIKAPQGPLSDMSILCLLYTSPSPRDLSTSRMPSSA